MSINSRDALLQKLRAARRPFPDAPPRPAIYRPVVPMTDTAREALIERFAAEITNLKGTPLIVDDDRAACETILELLRRHEAEHVLAWDLQHIPVAELDQGLRGAGIDVMIPHTHDAHRPDVLRHAERARVGITGVDAAAAATGTLIFTGGPGKGRIPAILPPVHIAVVDAGQIVAQVEDWIAAERARGLEHIREAAHVFFVTGPSRTGDIEMQLVLGVHGPGTLYTIIRR